MHWLRYCVLAAFTGAAALAWQTEKAELSHRADHGREIAAPAEPVSIISEAELLAGAGGGGCKEVGALTETFTFTSRYRGNVYRIESEVTLTEIQMQLGLANSTPLHVAIHQRQPNGSWTRYPNPTGDDFVITNPPAGGTGSMQFYSTGLLNPPVVLAAGADYAIAFAWGNTQVRFGNDVAQYPQATPSDFDFGQVLGRVGPVLSGLPEIPDSIPSLTITTNGAYSMQLCVTGACCLPSGACADVSQSECNSLFGQFTASGTTCDDVQMSADPCPLSRGACCLTPSGCSFTNVYACESADGTSWSMGTQCDDPIAEPCAPRGGCCFGDGSCTPDLTGDACESLGGIYRGDNVSCETSPLCSEGACCYGETCVGALTEAECGTSGGAFVGPGSSCNNNPCIPTGACCTGSTGVCTDDMTRSQCEAAGRTYRGDNTDCETIEPICGQGACCTSDTGCEDSNGAGITSGLCSVIGGTFRGDGTTCDTLDPQCPGTCCRGSNFQTCNSNVQPAQCTQLSGTFIGYGQTCPTQTGQANPCSFVGPATGGACCLPGGGCSKVSTPTLCAQLNPAVGAAAYHAGMSCSQVDCTPPPPTGACCDRVAAVCQEALEQESCSGFGKVWHEGGDCASFSPPCEPTGACCNRASLTCTNNTLDGACDVEWTARTQCSALDPPCAPQGACCSGTDCLVETQATCFALGGTYQGDDTMCDDEICAPRGACCQDSICSTGTAADCSTIGGVYQGDDTVCDAETCAPRGGCCDESNECSETTELGCDGRYLGDDSVCGVDICVPKGACCVGETCSDNTTADACADLTGQYAGDDTACSAETCASGACCHSDCTCEAGVVGHVCQADGGQFHPGQATCDGLVCENFIISSDPPNCAIDARESDDPVDLGWDSITLTMACDATGLTETDFALSVVPGPGAIAIDQVTPNGTVVEVVFDGPIPLQQYTCVTHTASGTQSCLSYLPGDANASEQTDSDDVLAIVGHLDETAPTLQLWQCDADRTGVCTPLDVLRNIDLQNGPEGPPFWNLATTNAPCPSAVP